MASFNFYPDFMGSFLPAEFFLVGENSGYYQPIVRYET